MNRNADLQGLYAIVLAAGASRRLGSPKQLLELGGKTLIEHAIAGARAICDSRVVVVLGAFSDRIRPRLEDDAVSIVENSAWESGMASSLKAGLRALPADCEAALILLSDQPKISVPDLERLAHTWTEAADRIVASGYGGTVGVPAVFPRATFGELERLSGDSGARQVLRDAGDAVIAVPLPAAAFDVDDEATARQLSAGQSRNAQERA